MLIVSVCIIGSGPAALSAAIDCAYNGLSVLVIERYHLGGSIGKSAMIENYPGMANRSGESIMKSMVDQALDLGVLIWENRVVTNILEAANNKPNKLVCLEEGDIMAKAVLIATGLSCKKIDMPGMAEFENKGVYYTPTLNQQKAVDRFDSPLICGSGNSAAICALYLATRCANVGLMVKGTSLSKMSEKLAMRVMDTENIEIKYGAQIDFCEGSNGQLSMVRGTEVGAGFFWHTKHLFVFAGGCANTAWLPKSIHTDRFGFIWANDTMETSMYGVFVAGSVRRSSLNKMSVAVGEGGQVAHHIYNHIQAES